MGGRASTFAIQSVVADLAPPGSRASPPGSVLKPCWTAPAFKQGSPHHSSAHKSLRSTGRAPTLFPFLCHHRENLLWTNALELENWSPGLEIRLPEGLSAGRGTHLGFLTSSWINSRSNSPWHFSYCLLRACFSLLGLGQKKKTTTKKRRGGWGDITAWHISHFLIGSFCSCLLVRRIFHPFEHFAFSFPVLWRQSSLNSNLHQILALIN